MDDAAHAQVYQGSGYAVLPHPAGGQPWRLEQQVEVDRVVYMEAERPLKIASLVNALHVPGLTADDQAGWSDPGFLSPHSVLAHLDTLENAEPADRSDRRERKVMLCQIAPAEVSEAAE